MSPQKDAEPPAEGDSALRPTPTRRPRSLFEIEHNAASAGFVAEG